MNVCKFVKEHIPLCVCTLGLAVLGYLGYHAVCWIATKCCPKIEKIDRVALRNLKINSGKITIGQGEYVVFHQSTTGKKPLSRETFEQVYKVLLQHSPTALINSGSEKPMEKCANRYELLKMKLQEIDPTVQAVFVPRTLYELVFIRKCIEEDLNQKEICPYLSPDSHNLTADDFAGDKDKYDDYLKEREIRQKEKRCWHLCCFTDKGDDEHSSIKNVAYRLNKALFKALDPQNEGWTHLELSALAKKEIEFLKNHYKNGLIASEKIDKGEKDETISSCNTPGPTTNFGFESVRGSIKPAGIRNEKDAQIIMNALALDCSKIAEQALFLYRGTKDFKKDLPSSWKNKDKAFSLSYGTSLFAGCLYDGGAVAFHHMRNGQNAYAIPVSFDQLKASPFFVPTTHTVTQLFGTGEIFHARTKAWKDFNVQEIGGIDMGGYGDTRDHLKSNLTKEELNTQFKAYKNQALQLN